jgi:endo-alpha-1,4-polygalactosaminidase (GH114 family)
MVPLSEPTLDVLLAISEGHFMGLRTLLFAFLLLVPVVVADLAEAGKSRPQSFRLYYGNEPRLLEQLIHGLAPGQVVVIESRALAKPELARLLSAARTAQAKVLGYLSIGEMDAGEKEAFRCFLAEFVSKHSSKKLRFPTLDSIVLQRDEKFNAEMVDVLAEAWRAYVLARLNGLYAAGLDGVFLDTVDTVDIYSTRQAWTLPRRLESVRAMMDLVRAVKARNRDKYVLQNRGLNLIGKSVFVGNATGVEVPGLDLATGHRDNPDGVLWEDAFAGRDPWSLRVEQELQKIQRSGRADVFTLGYQATLKTPGEYFRRSATLGFIAAWATSSERLHREVTALPAK